jgi:NAD(P)-dependent dehydrogenase (short-subunit alcohol dehydrogenase family)
VNVVITGSTRGIGFGLAREFLARGHSVVVSGRTTAASDRAAAELAPQARGGARVVAHACDVGSPEALRGLWAAGVAAFGRIDCWVNNAGVVTERLNLVDVPEAEIDAALATNIAGTVQGTRVALAGMLAQGAGRIFNVEGFGSDGIMQPGLTVYGTTKRAVTYFTRSVVKEYRDSPVIIGTIQPGIVLTDLLEPLNRDPARRERTQRFYNIMADRVETVVPFLVDGMLAARRTGAAIRWLTPAKALGRFAKSLVVKRDLFEARRA